MLYGENANYTKPNSKQIAKFSKVVIKTQKL